MSLKYQLQIKLLSVRLCETPDNNADVSNAVFTPTQGSYECGRKVIFGCKDECHEHAEGK